MLGGVKVGFLFLSAFEGKEWHEILAKHAGIEWLRGISCIILVFFSSGLRILSLRFLSFKNVSGSVCELSSTSYCS